MSNIVSETALIRPNVLTHTMTNFNTQATNHFEWLMILQNKVCGKFLKGLSFQTSIRRSFEKMIKKPTKKQINRKIQKSFSIAILDMEGSTTLRELLEIIMFAD